MDLILIARVRHLERTIDIGKDIVAYGDIRMGAFERNMRLLAVSAPNDEHAALPVHILQDFGCDVEFWSPSDVPLFDETSVRIGREGVALASHQRGDPERDLSCFDVVLFRKYTQPAVPDHVHPADAAIVKRELGQYVDNCFRLIAPAGFWVNPWLSLFSCGKLEQLAIAQRLGWPIPETLVSYRPEAIREFYDRHRDRGVIVKSFTPAVWRNSEGKTFASYTSELTPELLDDELCLASAPAIYQERVEKRYELRVTMFGDFGICVRIESQNSDVTRLDWRAGGSNINLRRIDLDEPIRLMCAEMMAQLGIRFGCFDFIIDAEGEAVFLEVNPAGQFLWIEDIDPNIPLLSYFCEFLMGGRPDFSPQGRRLFPSLGDVSQSREYSEFSRLFAAGHPRSMTGMINQE